MIRCPTCDHSMPESARFCPECGTSLTSPRLQAMRAFPLTEEMTHKGNEDNPELEKTMEMSPSKLPAFLRKLNHFYAPKYADDANLFPQPDESEPEPVESGVGAASVGKSPRKGRRERDIGRIIDGRYDTGRPGTWQKIVSTAEPRRLTSFPPKPPRLRPVIMYPQRSALQPKLFFAMGLVVIVVLILAGAFGVASSWGKNLLIVPTMSAQLTLEVSPSNVVVGGTMRLHGSHFTPHGRVGLMRDNAIPTIDTDGKTVIEANENGEFSDTMIVGEDWGAGPHVVSTEDAHAHRTASFPIIITGKTASLRPAHLLLSTNVLDLETGDQATSSTKSVKLSNTGGGQISWQATASQSWLLISPQGGTFNSGQDVEVKIAVDRSNLDPGSYAAEILFSSTAGEGKITVQMETTPLLQEHQAMLQLTPSLLSFTGVDGGSQPAAQAVVVSNPGARPLRWGVSVNSDWIVVEQSSGTVEAADSQTVVISVDTRSLLPGTYHGLITFSSQGNEPVRNSPQSIAISLTVTPSCALQISPGLLTFAGIYRQAAPVAQSLAIMGTDGCTGAVKWGASSAVPWLTLSNTTGLTPSHIVVSVDTSNLDPGNYSGTITFSSESGTITVPVTVTVGSGETPLLSTDNRSLDISETAGQVSPVFSPMIQIANIGSGNLNWNVSASTQIGGAWLSVTPTSGGLKSHGVDFLHVSINHMPDLLPGLYSGTITINALDEAGNAIPGSPLIIPVIYVIKPPCGITATDQMLSFSFTPGKDAPAAQKLTLRLNDSCTHSLNWQITKVTNDSTASWLTVTPATGTLALNTPTIVNVSVDPTNLAPQSYQNTLTVTAIDATTQRPVGESKQVMISFSVISPCSMDAGPSAPQSFATALGGTPATKRLSLGVSGVCSGKVTLVPKVIFSSGRNWLDVSPTPAAILSGTEASFTIKANPATLTKGEYNAVISVAGTDKGVSILGSPQLINVHLIVDEAASLKVTPTALTVNATTGTVSQPITISNVGGVPLDWQATLASNAPAFVSLSSTTGSGVKGGTSATTNLVVNATGLPGGKVYTTSVTFTALNETIGGTAKGSPITIPITLRIASPAMQLSSTNLTYTSGVGGSPAAQSVTITNTGGDGLTWKVGAASQSWLTATPGTGSSASGASSPLGLQVNTTGLQPGKYTASVTITPNVGNAIKIDVTLTIAAAPSSTPTPTNEQLPTPTPSATAIYTTPTMTTIVPTVPTETAPSLASSTASPSPTVSPSPTASSGSATMTEQP